MVKRPGKSKYWDRIKTELMEYRKDILGENLETIWRQADRDYLPHRLGKKGKKILVQDEDKGWASRFVELGKDKWQTDVATVNPLIKIQTALSILIARNPSVELTPGSKKYENSTLLQKELYKKSWELAKSIQQLKLFAFNLSKYGWAVARTYPMKLQRGGSVEFNGVYRENLDPWMTWIDDKTRPNSPMSTRDWAWAKWYDLKALKEEFGKEPGFKHIQKGKSELLDTEYEKSVKKFAGKDMKLVYFYENLDNDAFTSICDGIELFEKELPLEDSQGNKKLSLWHAPWMLRHAELPYGIGIPEVIRNDKILYNKFRNMTSDQVILSIYKMWFYEGTDQIDSDGRIKLSPGVGKQVSNPKNIKWVDVPAAGKEAWEAIKMMQDAIDEASGVSRQLTSGEEVEKTAYQSAQRAEFGLRRLNTPLDNITDALEQDAQLTMIINEMIYSIPEIVKINNPDLIARYYEEIKGDAELYERDDQDNFYAKLYPEVQMNLDTDEQERLVESEDARFFRVKPRGLKWEGMISVKGQSILIETKTLAKQMTLEIFNIITPMLQWPKELVLKPIKQLCKKYEVDWKEWIPDEWLTEQPEQQPQQGLFIPQDQQTQQPQTLANQTILPKNEVKPSKSNLISQSAGLLKKPAMAIGK